MMYIHAYLYQSQNSECWLDSECEDTPDNGQPANHWKHRLSCLLTEVDYGQQTHGQYHPQQRRHFQVYLSCSERERERECKSPCKYWLGKKKQKTKHFGREYLVSNT